jgi:hypothetical protein
VKQAAIGRITTATPRREKNRSKLFSKEASRISLTTSNIKQQQQQQQQRQQQHQQQHSII